MPKSTNGWWKTASVILGVIISIFVIWNFILAPMKEKVAKVEADTEECEDDMHKLDKEVTKKATEIYVQTRDIPSIRDDVTRLMRVIEIPTTDEVPEGEYPADVSEEEWNKE